MDIELNVLNKITETAVKAACIRDYDISPLKKRYIDPEGNVLDTDIDPPPRMNRLLDLESCAGTYERYKQLGAEVFVGFDFVVVTHDDTRTTGKSGCELLLSETIKTIIDKQHDDLRPEAFEKIAKLYFGADSQFINRIRKLQWKEESDTTTRLSSVSKSADVQEIARVVDENEILFQDISLFVNTPYFLLPYETEPVEIELHIIACAAKKTIAFAPKPGVLLQARHDAQAQVLKEVNRLIGERVAIFGTPKYSS